MHPFLILKYRDDVPPPGWFGFMSAHWENAQAVADYLHAGTRNTPGEFHPAYEGMFAIYSVDSRDPNEPPALELLRELDTTAPN